jgi:hypothetical protein
MLQKPSSGVLASLKASTYHTEYASAFRSLRPCWKGFFTILCLHDAICGLVKAFVNGLSLGGFATVTE